MKVSQPSEDICTYCYCFSNHHKHASQPPESFFTPGTEIANVEQANDKKNNDSDIVEELGGNLYFDIPADPIEQAPDPAIESNELLLLRAARHVKSARAQRKRFQNMMQRALTEPRVKTLVVDYAQNLELPWLGQEQGGETYYFSPLNVYVLGIVDTAHNISSSHDHLYAHVYDEGQGAKGGNNVASLIMKTLKMLGWLDDPQIQELSIVFDNCTGQNKNNYVLRLIPYLVEME